MFSRTLSCSVATFVVLSAAVDGGPKAASGHSLLAMFGSDPYPSPCNTNGLNHPICPPQAGMKCTATYDKCMQQNPGVQQNELCDAANGGNACNVSGCVITAQDRLDNQTPHCTAFTPPP